MCQIYFPPLQWAQCVTTMILSLSVPSFKLLRTFSIHTEFILAWTISSFQRLMWRMHIVCPCIVPTWRFLFLYWRYWRHFLILLQFSHYLVDVFKSIRLRFQWDTLLESWHLANAAFLRMDTRIWNSLILSLRRETLIIIVAQFNEAFLLGSWWSFSRRPLHIFTNTR